MVTKIGSRRPPHLYIREWREHRNWTLEQLGARIGEVEDRDPYDKGTVSRWETDQRRLNPGKIGALARAFDLDVENLFRPPGHESLDAMVRSAPADVQDTAREIVRALTRRAS